MNAVRIGFALAALIAISVVALACADSLGEAQAPTAASPVLVSSPSPMASISTPVATLPVPTPTVDVPVHTPTATVPAPLPTATVPVHTPVSTSQLVVDSQLADNNRAAAFCRYVEVGEFAKARAIFEEDGIYPDSECDDRSESVPLHFAVEYGAADLARALLDADANVDARNFVDETPLHFAAKKNYVGLARMLLDAGAAVDAKDDEGRTPLHKACESGNVAVAGALIEAGANMYARNRYGTTIPLDLAFRREDNIIKMVQVFITAGYDVNKPDNDGWKLVHWGHRFGNRGLARILVDAGADVNAVNIKGETALHLVAWWDNADYAQGMIDAGANIDETNDKGETPLHWASLYAKMSETKAMSALINAGADVNAKAITGLTPLHYALQTNPHFFYRHWHSEEERKSIVEAYSKFNALTLLIDAGAYVNAKDNALRTPLHIAVVEGDYSEVEALIDAGADTAATDKNGRTPADYAAAQGYDDLAELLR